MWNFGQKLKTFPALKPGMIVWIGGEQYRVTAAHTATPATPGKKNQHKPQAK
jgi:hypothetical protein